MSAKEYFSFVSNPSPLKFFITEMNKLAKELNLVNTYFVNPHGLINFNNRSSALDLASLSYHVMQKPVF